MVLSGDGAFLTLLLSAPHSPRFFLGRRFLGRCFLGRRFLGRRFLGRCFLGRRFLDTQNVESCWATMLRPFARSLRFVGSKLKDTGTLQLKRTLWMFFDAAYGELLGNKASSWVSGSYIFPPLVKASRYHTAAASGEQLAFQGPRRGRGWAPPPPPLFCKNKNKLNKK